MSDLRIWLQIGLFLLGGALFYVGEMVGSTSLTALGLACTGCVALIGAFDILVTRRLESVRKRRNTVDPQPEIDATAFVWSIFLIVFSAVMFTLAYMSWRNLGNIDTAWNWLVHKDWGWGVIWCVIGLVIALVGGVRVLSTQSEMSQSYIARREGRDGHNSSLIFSGSA
jgi:hypothetical protein